MNGNDPQAAPFAVNIGPQVMFAPPIALGPKGDPGASMSPTSNVSVTAAQPPGVVVASPGYLCSVTVTSAGSSALMLSDGQNGPVIAIVNASQPTGDIIMSIKRFNSNLYVASGPGTPAVTLGIC